MKNINRVRTYSEILYTNVRRILVKIFQTKFKKHVKVLDTELWIWTTYIKLLTSSVLNNTVTEQC